ncbi:hypothetical protein ACFCXR_27785 [Streptomyces noursei]|uniref:hypothetical protein n=1 Tax=Streptomyces TaxID=1883 RepID=UPI002F26637E
MKQKEPQPPKAGVIFSATVGVAIGVGASINQSMSGWQSTVAMIVSAIAIGLMGRLWYRQADLRYRTVCMLSAEQNDAGDGAS